MTRDEIKTGGPAFPEVRIRNGDNYNAPIKIYYGGMTLRDYFAAKALQGMLTNPDYRGSASENVEGAYRFADEMLKERLK